MDMENLPDELKEKIGGVGTLVILKALADIARRIEQTDTHVEMCLAKLRTFEKINDIPKKCTVISDGKSVSLKIGDVIKITKNDNTKLRYKKVLSIGCDEIELTRAYTDETDPDYKINDGWYSAELLNLQLKKDDSNTLWTLL